MDILHTPLLPVYDPDPTKPSAYQFFIHNRPAIEAAAVAWYTRANGRAPSDPDICHGGLWRPINEPWRWGTLNNAWRDTWPYEGMPPADPFTSVPPPPVPPAPSTLHLERRGNDFVNAQGERVVLPGVDGFDDLFLRVNGRESELDALTEQSRQLDFVVRRVWCMGDAIENTIFTLHPQDIGMTKYIDLVRGLVAYENARRSIPLLTYFVDAQRVYPNAADRQRFCHDMNDGLLGCGLYLISGGNEADKNGFDPYTDVFDPGHDVVWSRASGLEDQTLAPRGASATELHATRNSFDRALMDATASPPTMRANYGAGMVWMTEGNPFGDANGYTPDQAWALARGYSILWALAVFHDRQSQRGQLMTADTQACAAAWVRGLRTT